MVEQVLVVDSDSTDGTAQIARQMGAEVLHEPRRGYGRACLTGLAAVNAPDVVVFLDGDYSDRPAEMSRLL
jgi:glycosyltransferase involved in cell wall biosynthesis